MTNMHIINPVKFSDNNYINIKPILNYLAFIIIIICFTIVIGLLTTILFVIHYLFFIFISILFYYKIKSVKLLLI